MNPGNERRLSDKRRAPRSRHNSVLEIFDTKGHVIAGIGRLVNFSMVGACFSSTEPFSKGAKINGRLRLLREGVLKISGHIVWSKKKANATLYGLAFDSLHQLHRS
jgi:hypothetical protein